MSFADIENMWHSPHNRPSPAQVEKEKMKLVLDLKRRHRGFVLFTTVTLALLLLITGRVVFHLLWPNPADDTIDLTREWAVLPLLALPWIGWFLLVRHYRRHRARHRDYASSISASVRALLDENRLERARTKLVAWLIVGLLLIVPLIVHQLRAVGKAGDEIILPAFAVLPAIEIAILLALAYRYRRKLLPRRRQLEELLRAYESTESVA